MFKKILLVLLLAGLLLPLSPILAADEITIDTNVSLDTDVPPGETNPTAAPVPATNGMVSINFDDGLLSTYTLAAPLLAQYGFVATAYIYPQAQNKKYPGYLSWQNVVDLQNKYGWEIGSHGLSHSDLSTLTLAAAKSEMNQSKNQLIKHGLTVQSFASPYGAYNDGIVDYATKIFSSHRTAWNLPNTWPINDYYLKALTVAALTPVSEVKTWIDQAANEKQWLILLFHALTPDQPSAENEAYNLDNFRQILDYLKEKNLPVLTTAQGVQSWASGSNLASNGGFEQGTIPNADYWLRSNTTQVKIIANNRGQYPTVLKNAVIQGNKNDNTLSSIGLKVNPATTYRLKAFYRLSNYLQGDVSVWLSEFDNNYTYLGGQWLGGFNQNFIGTRYFDYHSSPSANQIEIFFIVHGNSKLKLEIDNVELRAL